MHRCVHRAVGHFDESNLDIFGNRGGTCLVGNREFERAAGRERRYACQGTKTTVWDRNEGAFLQFQWFRTAHLACLGCRNKGEEASCQEQPSPRRKRHEKSLALPDFATPPSTETWAWREMRPPALGAKCPGLDNFPPMDVLTSVGALFEPFCSFLPKSAGTTFCCLLAIISENTVLRCQSSSYHSAVLTLRSYAKKAISAFLSG